MQLEAAHGDAGTVLPPSLTRPAHWRDGPGNPGGGAGRRYRTVGMPGNQRGARAPIAAAAIGTADLVLRPVSRTAAAALTRGDFSRIRAGEGWPHEDSLDALRMAAQGISSSWLVTLSDVVVGECGTHGPPDPAGVVEIGYGLAAPYRGRGYGRQAVRALARWLLGQPGVTAVLAHADPGNVPSRRSLEGAGFRFEGSAGGQCRYRLTGQYGGSE
jgi:RimJ/RimL family protein N-acetyltransferase